MNQRCNEADQIYIVCNCCCLLEGSQGFVHGSQTADSVCVHSHKAINMRRVCTGSQPNDLSCQGMLQALDDNSDTLDEAFLSSCFAYIKKASDDGLSEIVYLLQRILQLYAARYWSQVDASGKDDAMLLDILAADEKNWQNMIHDLASAGMFHHTLGS